MDTIEQRYRDCSIKEDSRGMKNVEFLAFALLTAYLVLTSVGSYILIRDVQDLQTRITILEENRR